MILLVNIFLTNSHLYHKYERGHLSKDNNFDIFKYSISSIAPIFDWSQVILNVKLDECFKHREEEMYNLLSSLFKNQKNLSIDLYNRNEYQKDWIKTCESLVDDNLIFFACNHDHIFLDSNIEYFRGCIKTLRRREKETGVFTFSHFPEMIDAMANLEHKIDESIIYLNAEGSDSFVTITKEWFTKLWTTANLGNERVIRTDGLHAKINLAKQDFFAIPSRETFRHYDGYNNIVKNTRYFLSHYPPLVIPPGFFQNEIVINYGNTYEVDVINILFDRNLNSCLAGSEGSDCFYLPEEIPIVWKSRIKEIKYNYKINPEVRINQVKNALLFYAGKSKDCEYLISEYLKYI